MWYSGHKKCLEAHSRGYTFSEEQVRLLEKQHHTFLKSTHITNNEEQV